VGQTIKAAGLLGKVEATTFLNTRIRTFDGKIFFVPNRIILNDVVINYHHLPTRRMKIDIPIRYDQGLIKAKQVLEAIMIAGPRVKKMPRPVVWVLDLSNGCIVLGG
jgi:small conductance mechanosensitive channel